MLKKMAGAVVLLMACAFFASCISMETYNRKMRACQKTQKERDYYQSKVTELREEVRGMEETQSKDEVTKSLMRQEIDEKDKKLVSVAVTYEDVIAELKDYIADGDVGVVSGADGKDAQPIKCHANRQRQPGHDSGGPDHLASPSSWTSRSARCASVRATRVSARA